MRRGLTIPLGHVDLHESLAIARESAALGYEDCWLAEMGGPDSATLAGALAVTTTLRVGTAILPAQTRSPFVLAMTAATAARLGHDRFVLGLGVSSEVIVAGWNGAEYARPLRRMRETVEVIRSLLAGEKVTYEGETLHLSAARLSLLPENPVPIHVAALNPGMLRLAGEIADGVILVMLGPEHLARAMEFVADGARRAGRDPSDIEVVVRVPVVIAEDAQERYRIVRTMLFTYLGVPAFNRYLEGLGYVEETAMARAAWVAGDRNSTFAAVSDRMVDDLAIAGDLDACRAGVDAFERAGTGVLVTVSNAEDAAGHRAIVAAMAPGPEESTPGA